MRANRIEWRRLSWAWAAGLALGWLLVPASQAEAKMLWTHPERTLICTNGTGVDILHGAVKPHDDTASDTLYFKFRATPISDILTKTGDNASNYIAGFVLSQGGVEKLGIGNAWSAWGYSVFGPTLNFTPNKPGELNLNTANLEPNTYYHYEGPRRGIQRTFVIKVDYVPDGEDRVTVWLGPDLSPGKSEETQPEDIVTHFNIDASFDQIRLIHRGAGGGWIFSGLAIATSFQDFEPVPFWQRGWVIVGMVLLFGGGVANVVWLVERRRNWRRIQQLERERAVAEERSRIAQDLHDDLGARMTKIGMLAEMAEMADGKNEPGFHLREIRFASQEMIQALDETVWIVNPRNDTLRHLAEWLLHYTGEFLGPTPLRWRLKMPDQLPDMPLSTEVRHSLFMVVKEVLNNVVKYAAASMVELELDFDGEVLQIVIQDDGRGFSPGECATGNGLKNMRARLTQLGGTCEVRSALGKGARVILMLNLRQTHLYAGCQ